MFAKEMVSLYETVIWIGFWFILIIIFRKTFVSIIDALKHRIMCGAAFTLGPMSIGEPPKELSEKGPNAVLVSDRGEEPRVPDNELVEILNDKYRVYQNQYFVLHASEIVTKRIAPKSGIYRVRIWIESYKDPKLLNIQKVTYRLWDDFYKPIISTKSNISNFDVWLSVYGEFPVFALIELKNGDPIWLPTYIELPDRPSF